MNILKSIYFNFKMLPLKQAIKLPIHFINKTRFINLNGKIEIRGQVYKGMINIGGYHSEMMTPLQNILDVKGKIVFNSSVQLGSGCLIRVEKDGVLEFGKNVILGANSKIFCENFISIGDNTRIAWENQLFDTNFHYIKDLGNNRIINKIGEIKIGKYNWIGNRTTIMKNTITPNFTTVSSNSLCNKNYVSFLEEKSIIGGVPAKLLSRNKERVFDKQVEAEILKMFSSEL